VSATRTGLCPYCEIVQDLTVDEDGDDICADCLKTFQSWEVDIGKRKASTAAHEVPFAQEPNKTVIEKLTVTISTPETGTYCGCPRCRVTRAEFWQLVIESKLQQFADHSDPFRIFPEKHTVSVVKIPKI